LQVTINRCIEDVRLWANRCTKSQSSVTLIAWCNLYDPP
jgi:hypothetical protein